MEKYSLKYFFRKLCARYPFDYFFYVFSKGRTSDAFIFKLIPSHAFFKDKSWRNVRRNGLLFNLNISHIVDWYIFFGVKEIARESLYDLLKPGMTLYDIGGNIGDVTLNASLKLGNTGTVISFEPHPKTFMRLQNHIKINNLSNVVVFNLGLGSQNVNLEMEEIDNNAGANRIVGQFKSNSNTVIVKVAILDEIIGADNLKGPDVIKIDVEGFEMEVLKGALKTIKQFRPILFIELSDSLLKLQLESAKSMILFISKLGYRIVNANDKKMVNETSNLENCHFDIIAYPI